MNRIARRLATVAVPVVSALAAVLALGTPAEADATATVSWYPISHKATVQLNDEAVMSAASYGSGLGWAVDHLCSQVSDTVNAQRQAAGYTAGVTSSSCVEMVRDCVDSRVNNNVQVTIYRDLTYGCGSY
jgi:hypothetical protein